MMDASHSRTAYRAFRSVFRYIRRSGIGHEECRLRDRLPTREERISAWLAEGSSRWEDIARTQLWRTQWSRRTGNPAPDIPIVRASLVSVSWRGPRTARVAYAQCEVCGAELDADGQTHVMAHVREWLRARRAFVPAWDVETAWVLADALSLAFVWA